MCATNVQDKNSHPIYALAVLQVRLDDLDDNKIKSCKIYDKIEINW